jgi:hypothetical protein
VGHVAPGPDASGLHRWVAASWFGQRAHLYRLNCNPCGRPLPLSRFPSIMEPLIKQATEASTVNTGNVNVWSVGRTLYGPPEFT